MEFGDWNLGFHQIPYIVKLKYWFRYMPTVIRSGPYRFFFYSGDRNEPSHIHVERDEKIAKFWLEPVRLQYSGGFNRKEINRIQKIIQEYKGQLLEGWHDYFGC